MAISQLYTSRNLPSLSSLFTPTKKPLFPLQTLIKIGFTPTLFDFNFLLRFLYQNLKFKSITQLFSQMNSNQIMGNAYTHSIFTWALLKQHKYEEAEQFVRAHMEKLKKDRIFDCLIQGLCVAAKDPEKGFSVLRDSLRFEGTLPSSYTFCSLIYSFSSLGNMDRAIEVLEMMTDERFRYPFDNFVCSSVISGFCRIGKPELAVGFYENAEKTRAFRANIMTYTALLNAYCRLSRSEDVSNLVSRIENEGLCFDVVFYSSWIHEYFKDGVPWEALSKLREMVEKKIEMDTVSYTILIDGFSKEGHVEKAVGFLHKMSKEKLMPNLVTYTAIISGFCKKGKLKEAFSLLKVVEDLGIEADEFLYATLIDGVCRQRDFDRVFRLLNDMEKKGIKPSIVTFNTVINGLCKAGRASEADEFSKGIIGDTYTYSILIHGYIKEENETGILEMKKKLELSGVQMDVIMCNILIKALFMVGSFEDALAIYKEMSKLDLVANAVTYCTMIDGYCKSNRMDEALEIFDEFRANSIPSVACYNCIIHGLCDKGMSDVAVEVFLELYEKGFSSDAGLNMMLINAVYAEKGITGVLDFICRIENLREEIFDIMSSDAIYILCKKGFVDAAIYVYVLMERKGSVDEKSYDIITKALTCDGKEWLLVPFLSTLVKLYGILEPRVTKILMHYLCTKDMTNAINFVALMNKSTLTFTIPTSVLRTLIRDGKAFDAYKLIVEAENNLPVMNVIDYTMVIDGLCKGGYLDKALHLCTFAKRKGTLLNIVTYNSVINGLCQQGCFIEAFRLFDSLEKVNMVPSEITYSTLINILSKEGYLVDARKLFDSMVLKELNPNTRVYNSLIDGYCKLGKIKEASRLLVEMELRGLQPDEFTISFMMNGFYQKGDMEKALELFLESKEKGLLPDFLGFLYLIRGLYSKGRMEECRNILSEMLQNESVSILLNKAGTVVEMESTADFLLSLCEQGSIKEVVMVLNEAASIFFPLPRRSSAYVEKEELKDRCDGILSLGTAVCEPPSSICISDIEFKSAAGDELEKMVRVKGSQRLDFESFYSVIASLCSSGDLGKANKLAKLLCGS